MSYEQEFMKEFEAWVNTQIMINDMAHKESQKVYEEDQDERAKDAMIRYESRLDAYQFLLGKFENFKAGKGFHDLPEGLFGERNYWNSDTFLIFFQNLDRISLLNPCQNRDFLLKGFYHVKETPT